VSWSICRWYQLGGADADDVGQNVWLTLLGQLGNLRDPAALPGWLATTTQRECLRILRAARTPHAGARSLDAENIPDQHTGIAEEELLGIPVGSIGPTRGRCLAKLRRHPAIAALIEAGAAATEPSASAVR